MLDRHPDLDFIYSDEDKLDEHGNVSTPFFKPSWSPELHLCVNYVTHFAVYRKSLFDRLGGFRAEFDGSQDYDLSLRLTEVTHRVGHIAKPLYTWRMVVGSAAISHDAKPYAVEAARQALSDTLDRRWAGGRIEEGLVPGTWRPRYPVVGQPMVSVLIPTRNGRKMLERCLEGVLRRTAYGPVELVIVDNGSDEPETLEYLAGLEATVVRYPYRFNYARQMNLAAAAATGDLLLLLNNDAEITDSGWLEAMVEHAQRPEVGAVGARLLFPSGRPQHEGVFLGFGGGTAGNIDFGDYFQLGRLIRDCTAVTAACMMTRAAVFAGVGGFDERLRVAFNDVDFCLRLRQRGYRIVYTPYAELLHAESASRGSLHPAEDEAFFVRRWGCQGEFDDPFYNPNLDPVRPFRLIR
jgi:GT2 family glycosyltransferase